MDRITINDVLEALKIINAKMELIDSRNISGVTQKLLNIAGSDLKIVEETDIEENIELNRTYYYGKSEDIENAILESDNSPRLETEDEYVALNIPDWDMPVLQFSISNPNDEYNFVNALWGSSLTQPQRIDNSINIKAILSEIIEKSADENDVERTKNALSFLDSFMELTLEKDTNRDNKINTLTRREQLMKKLTEQEKTLKSQESEIQSLDYDIKRLESKQEEK